MDLILRPSDLIAGKPWALQLRQHDLSGVDYETLARLAERQAYAVMDAGAAYFLFGDPRDKPEPVAAGEGEG